MPFVVLTWNGVPAKGGKNREVYYLSENKDIYGVHKWTRWRSEAAKFEHYCEAMEKVEELALEHLKEDAIILPEEEAYERTGGIPGKEIT